YVVFQRRRWEISIPLQLGLGQATYQTHVTTTFTDPRTHEKVERSFNRPDENNLIFLGELSVNAHYKIFTWLGIGVGFGYRRLFNDNDNPKIASTFDYPIWLWKVKIFPFELKNVFKGKSKWYSMD
ncbi:MAG: hypothetical protein K2Q22_06880, partial [Cytophagales bacterium]|nr:hypothetical protein [Cytophagales bacterium]